MQEKPNRLRHKIGWVVANSLGIPVIVYILFMLLEPAKDSGGIIGLFILFCGTGSLLGLAQALSLKPWVRPVWWVLATAIGSGTSILIMFFALQFEYNFDQFTPSWIGLFQSLAIRNQGKKVYSWFVFCFIGHSLGIMAAIFVFIGGVNGDTSWPSLEQIVTVVFVYGLIYGVVTQFFLFWFLRRLR